MHRARIAQPEFAFEIQASYVLLTGNEEHPEMAKVLAGRVDYIFESEDGVSVVHLFKEERSEARTP
jgi:hypothetical protein